jgi:hypothetical protein
MVDFREYIGAVFRAATAAFRFFECLNVMFRTCGPAILAVHTRK